YTTPLSSLISQTSACHETQVNHHLYADDTQLFISFSPHAAHVALDSLHATLAAISQWMASNFLTLNPAKTELLIIGLPTQLSKLHMPNLILPDNSSITPVQSARNLGIIFDSNLSFDKHISNLSKICYFHIRDLRRIRPTLDFDTARTIATSLVHSKLDYCNSLYYNLPQSQLKRLQAIQNSLARCITPSSRFQHITPRLKSLHWLKVEQRIQYKLISLHTHLYNTTALSIFGDSLPYQPATGQPALPRSSLFSNHLLNSKLESILFLLQRHFYGALFQTRCASPLLMVYLDV